MTVFQSILLGIIQGLTEFLPISSSAHLVITPYLLNWNFSDQSAFIFDVIVQLGTLMAVVAYFWHDLINIIRSFTLGIWNKKPFTEPDARLGWLLILASLPAVLAGLFLKTAIEQAFSSPVVTSLFLVVTAGLLVAAEQFGKRLRLFEQTTWLDAVVIGAFQILSLFPGVSRSGSTITGGMLRGIDRQGAARFSFLMSIPVMIGAGTVAIFDLIQAPNISSQLIPLVVGFVVAGVVGYLSIRWLLGYLTRHTLYLFAAYCMFLALIVVIIFFIRGAG